MATPGVAADASRFIEAAVQQGELLATLLARLSTDGPTREEPARASGDVSATASASARGPSYIADLPSASVMTPPRILIADDEPAIATGLSAVLGDLRYEVEVVSDGRTALERLSSERFGLVLADLMMPSVDGLELLKELQLREIPTECIIITGQASVGSAVEAMQSGAYDYIEKPLNAEKLKRLKALIPKALDKYAVRERNRQLSSQLEGLTHYAEITGSSEAMREVYRVIEAVAPSTASVLILGESGTGKELVARALHSRSDRAKGPFFALNCAALPKEILENELFGHEKGAFTGSTNEKPGAFEMASGGTLFLDEVAEMPPDIQVKLLRSLETRVVRRLGGKKEIPVDIRILAATNSDVQTALKEGDMREDLYYRLAVVELYLPPLRERAGDIRLLANEFLGRFAQQNGKQITGFEDAAWEWILNYAWPGNVRDLKNAVERAVVLARGPIITRSEIMPRHARTPAAGEAGVALSIPVGSTLREAQRQLALRTLASTSGDVAKAAAILGISEVELRGEMAALLENGPEARAPVAAKADAPVAPGAGEESRSLGESEISAAPVHGANGSLAQPGRPSPVKSALAKKVTTKRDR